MTSEYYFIFLSYIETADKLTAALLLILGKTLGGVLVIPGTPLTILSGIILGTFLGTIVAVVGNLIGATLAFLLARYFLKDYVQRKILSKYPKINEFENGLSRNGFLTVVFLRLIPLFPFNILNFALGVTDIKLRDYFFGTLIGIIPGTFMFVYFGESVKMLSIYNIGFAILGILGLSYLGRFWKLK